jgi:TolB-like protein
MGKTLSVVIFLSLLASPLFSQEKMRLAVLDLESKGVSKVIASSVSDLLRTEMVDTGQFTVVERSQMNTILREHELQQTGCTDNACAVQVGKLLSAKKILIGEVNQMGAGVIITARVVDVEKGTADFASSERAGNLNDIDRATKMLAGKLTERITGRRVTATIPSSMTEDIRNNIIFRAARIRLGLGRSTISDSEVSEIFPEYPLPPGISTFFADFFFYRARNTEGSGFDVFGRFFWRHYKIDESMYAEYIDATDADVVPIGGKTPNIYNNNVLETVEYYEMDSGNLDIYGFNAGIRYIQGVYFSEALWQFYVSLAYQRITSVKSEVDFDYGNSLHSTINRTTFEHSYSASPYGAVGGIGVEISPMSYFGFFAEVTYGYSQVDMWGKKRNIDGLSVLFGVTLRSSYL